MGRMVRGRVSFTLLVLTVAGAGAAGTSLARGAATLARCESVSASGGDYDSAGGTIYAELRVTNTGKRACIVSGRPWIQVPRLDHPVTVAGLTDHSLAGRGVPVILAHGQQAHAYVLIRAGECNRVNGTTFTLWAHAGWASKGVTIVGTACDDGTAEIDVGSFER